MSKKYLKRLLSDLKSYRFWIIGSIFFTVINIGFGLLSVKLLGDITTKVADGATSSAGIDFIGIGQLIGYLLLLGVGIFITEALSELLLIQVTNQYTFKLRHQIFAKVGRLPVAYFNQNKTGDIITRIGEDTARIGESFVFSIAKIIRSSLYFIGAMIAMLQISPALAAIGLVTLVLTALTMKFILSETKKLSVENMTMTDKITSHIEEIFTNQLLISVNSREAATFEKSKRIIARRKRVDLKKTYLSDLIRPVQKSLRSLGTVAICFLGAIMVFKRQILIGQLQTVIRYFENINDYAFDIIRILPEIQDVGTSMERIFTFLDQPEEQDVKDPVTLPLPVLGRIEFRHVNFSYQGQPVIKDFSLKVEPGTKVAIVGPTGAGKTTLISLLMRFYDLDSGDILIDGISVHRLSKSFVRSLFGMVLQDTWMFSGSIKDNLAYSRPTATLGEIKSVAKSAHIDHIISNLPGGYDGEIAEDSENISAGEKQLFTIARAMIAAAPMLILDEATSNVDTRTEQYIQDAMAKLMQGRTTFVIAHRLSTIIDADLILVLKDGKIIERGNHQTLLERNGHYAKLHQAQFESCVEEEPDVDSF